jgi:hemerythrin superfamily protein
LIQKTRARKTNGKASMGRVLASAFGAEAEEATQPATKLLTQQHEEVKALFKRIEKSKSRAEKTKLFEEVAANLVAHDAIEREIFYPACKRAMGMTDLLGEALVEHGVVEFSVYQADQAGKDDFDFKCKVLSELVEHHVKEEEDEFFPKVEKALGRDRLEQLGARMKERFEEAKAEDFRGPLAENLKQVLAGTIEPTKRSGRSSAPSSVRLSKSKRRRAA